MMVETEPAGSMYVEDGSLETKLSGNSRMAFVRKVYSILAIQLGFTALYIAVLAFNQDKMRSFITTRKELFVLAFSGYIVTLYALGCYQQVARRVPLNYILLGVFTACFSYMTGFVTV